MAAGVECPVRRDRLARLGGDVDAAPRHLAETHVDDERRAVGPGGGEADGVRAEHSAVAAPRSDGLGSVAYAHGDVAGPCEGLDVVGDDPGMVGAADHRRGERRCREAVQQGPLRELDGRVGESVTGVDDHGRVREPSRLGGGMAVDLAAARLRRIGRDPRSSVPFLAVGLRRGQCVRDPLGIVPGRVVGHQDLDDEGAQLFEPESLFVRHGFDPCLSVSFPGAPCGAADFGMGPGPAAGSSAPSRPGAAVPTRRPAVRRSLRRAAA